MTNMDRLEAIVARLPEAERVDIGEWVVATKRLSRLVE